MSKYKLSEIVVQHNSDPKVQNKYSLKRVYYDVHHEKIVRTEDIHLQHICFDGLKQLVSELNDAVNIWEKYKDE